MTRIAGDGPSAAPIDMVGMPTNDAPGSRRHPSAHPATLPCRRSEGAAVDDCRRRTLEGGARPRGPTSASSGPAPRACPRVELAAPGPRVLLVESARLAPDERGPGGGRARNGRLPAARELHVARALLRRELQPVGGSQHALPARPGRPRLGAGQRLADRPADPRYYARAGELLGLPALERFEPEGWRERFTPDERLLFGEPLAPTVSLWARSPKRFGRERARARSLGPRGAAAARERHRHRSDETGARRARWAAGRSRAAASGRARTFVLASGGIENARLLLVSRERQERRGQRERSRRTLFMDHPRAVYGSVRLLRPARFPLLRLAAPRWQGPARAAPAPAVQEREGLARPLRHLREGVSGYAEAGYRRSCRR